MRSRKLVSLLALSGATLLAPAARAGCLPDTIPDNGYLGIGDPDSNGFGADAGMLCCPHVVDPGFPGEVSDVNVSIALTHTFVGDLVIKLGSPSGTISTLQSCAGVDEVDDTASSCPGNFANWDGSTILYDEQSEGPSAETMGDGLGTFSRVCLDNGICAHTPAHGAGQGDRLDTDFDGETHVGTWELCIGDRVDLDGGTWSLYEVEIKVDRTIPCVCGGKFRGGDRVIYQPALGPVPAAREANSRSGTPEGDDEPPPVGTAGEVMCGLNGVNDFVLVSWNGHTAGHNGFGNCHCPIGSLAPGATSGFYVFCNDLAGDLPWSDDFETGNTNHWSFQQGDI